MNKTVFHGSGGGRRPILLVSFIILMILNIFGSYILYSSIIVIPFWVLWLACIITYKGVLTKSERSFLTVSFVLLAIIFVYGLIGFSSIELLGLIGRLNWILSGVVAIFVMKLLADRELSTVYVGMFLSLFLMMLLFIRKGSTFLSIGDAREAVDVADAWYGSLLMLLSGLCLIVFLNVRIKLVRLVSLVLLVLTLYINVFILQRGTNVILTIAEISMILLFLMKRKTVVITLSVIFAALVLFASTSDSLITILNWLSEVSPSDRLSARFDELAIVLEFESMDVSNGSFASRSDLMMISWNTFTSSIGHFLFGAGEHVGDNSIIGHHSFILDTLACYGILGGTFLFIYFKNQFQIFMSFLDKKKEWSLYMQCAVVFLFYILRNFYGQVAYALVNLVILLFFPLTFQLIRYYKNK